MEEGDLVPFSPLGWNRDSMGPAGGQGFDSFGGGEKRINQGDKEMAYGDIKRRKSRSRSSWTGADQRRHEADMRRADRERARQQTEDQAKFNAMSSKQREKYLADVEAEKVRRQEEAQERKEEYSRKLRLQRDELVADSRLIGGFVHNEIAQAIAWKDSYGHRQGDWLDDPVAALTGQGGFGEETAKSMGIKLQVNLCLDCSNSMYHNRIHGVSVQVMRTMYLALDYAAKQLPADSLKVNLWQWAQSEDGKSVTHVNGKNRWSHPDEDDPRGYTAFLPDSFESGWTGEDTWIHPLFEALEKWELAEGDNGAYRLDIIISDGMLEHKTDARKGDVIQDRRDGNLQSIVLNFLPMSDWGDYRVPNRCVQYPATADNLLGLMRGILGDWLTGI